MIFVQTCFNLSLVLLDDLWCRENTCRGSTFLRWNILYRPPGSSTCSPRVQKISSTSKLCAFFSVGPPPQPLIALIVYTSLYYTQAVGRGGKVKEHHLVSEGNRDKDHLHIIPSICLLHAQYSPSNWQRWVICFQCPFLKFTSAPNALSLTGAIIVFFVRDEKKGGLPHTNDLWVIMIHVENLS